MSLLTRFYSSDIAIFFNIVAFLLFREESRQALLKTFKEENDHLVEFHQNEIRILAEEIDDLIKQKKVDSFRF